MDIKEVISYLTNGVGEIPYFRKTPDGEVQLFVADEQLFCIIPKYDDDPEYAEKVAEAICRAGELLQQAVNFRNSYSSVIQEKDRDQRKDIESGLSRAY